MLTIERVKQLLNDETILDEQAREIRNAFYALADLILDSLEEKEIKKYEQKT